MTCFIIFNDDANSLCEDRMKGENRGGETRILHSCMLEMLVL